MNRFALIIGGLGLAAGAAFAQSNFTGEIMDSSCAKMGSHATMEKEHKMAAGQASDTACTKACVKNGAQYVLYNPATKKTYALDDQTKPADFAGQRVTVNGKLDSAGNSIHVDSIKPAS